ncbi:dnaJ homolog subfamily C member 11 [Frankliniella occidentalis]|uniref:DnaJ homolog subfamily C member 11 n=1 Tax=Frankliniella occidentalis TaxID=133901 RepID=A0A6J1SIT8_FRAOC|nr:dnaJ homolog subfamily C member 11 [Frankliniella occidentalis]
MTDENNLEPDRKANEDDLYTFLNLPRDATPEQIQQAYRHFSRIYHPDKHTDPASKKDAETLFQKTKYAYEVLIDEVQRAIYDNYGLKSLEEMKHGDQWAVVQRTMTPQEIREEYERIAREQEQRQMYLQTRPKGLVKVRVNATDLFDSYPYDVDTDEKMFGDRTIDKWRTVEVSGMSFYQYIEAPLTTRNILSLSGELSTQNGTGSGVLSLSIRRLLSNRGRIAFTVDVGNGPVYSFSGYSTFAKYYFCDYGLGFHLDPEGIGLNLHSAVGLKLDDHLTGLLVFKGERGYSSLSTILQYQSEKLSLSLGVQFGIPDTNVNMSYSRSIIDDSFRLKFGARFGTLGARISYGAQKQVTDHSTVGATVTVGVPHGVSLTLKLTRADQTYLLPVQMCEDILPAPVFYSSILPIVGWIVIKKFLVDPMVRSQAEKDKEKQYRLRKKQMEQKQKEAEAAVNLMRAQFERIRLEEEGRRGLVIVEAKYGRIIASGDRADSLDQSEVIDVTVPMQCLVKDSKLILHEPSKSQLPGFYDPCVGEDKQLWVQYLFHNNAHEVTVKDSENLRIPKTSHRVNKS